jgi:hypothetical protein
LHRVAGILCVLAGCAASSTDDAQFAITFDPCSVTITTATPNAAIADALALWQIADDPAGTPIELRFEDASLAFYGFYDDQNGVVYINNKLTNPHLLAIVIAHELGHAFGLRHVDGRPSVMNAHNTTLVPNAEDLALTSSCARPRS